MDKFVHINEVVTILENKNELRKRVLVGKKTERIVFAVTPEMKAAIERIASEKATSISSMLTQLATDEVLANAYLFEEIK